MAWILTKNKTNGSGESQIDTIKVNDVILIPDSDKAVNIEVPTNTNDLVNNSGFITNTVDNLLNYYLKTETYSKNEVNSLIDAVSSVTFEVVQVLPSQDISVSTIYLVPKQDTETNDIYDEYIYVNNAWEKIGSTEMDLTNYVTTSDLNNALAAYTTSQNLNNLLNAKQDVLTPGNNINITNGVISATDTTYTSKPAVSGGTDVSLVTTGEKYNWNSKVDSSNLADVALSGDYNDLTNKPNLSGKQDKTDNGIKTTAKTVVGAINELLNKFANYFTKTEVNEMVDHLKAHTCTNLINPTTITQTKYGITFTNNGDGTYTANGTANGNAVLTLVTFNDFSILENTKLVGCPTGGTSSTYRMYITCYKGSTWITDYVDKGNGVILSNIPSGANAIRLNILISNGTTCNNLLFKPMLTTDLSATYNDFVGYSGDGELNENVAEIYAAEDALQNEGYKYPIINGVKNYTDSNGVYHKNLGVVDLGTLGWAYVPQYNYFYVNIPTIKIRTNNIECARYQAYDSNLSASNLPNMGIKLSADNKPIVFIKNTTYTDATAFKNAMSGVLLFYELGTPQTWNSKSEISRVSDETYTNLINPTVQTQTINGVTFTNNGDGTYTVNGTATAYTFLNLNYVNSSTLSVPIGTYKLTGTPPNNGGVYTRVVIQDSVTTGFDTGSGGIFTIPQGTTVSWARISIDSGTTCNSLLFKPMITTKLDATYDDYIPYSGSGALNENVAEMYKEIQTLKNAITELGGTV